MRDPTDAGRVCVCGAKGALYVLRFGSSVALEASSDGAAPAPRLQELRLLDSQNYQARLAPRAVRVLRCMPACADHELRDLPAWCHGPAALSQVMA